MISSSPNPSRLCGLLIPAVLAILTTVAACASAPPAPTASLVAARHAISIAERADASRYASMELDQARTRLASAEEEVAANRMAPGERLALEAHAAAELASAKTAASKARSVNEELMRNTSTFIEGMQPQSGDRP